MSEHVEQLIGSSAISFMLSFMLMKAWLPFAPKRAGEVLLTVSVGLIQRLLIHRWQAIAVLVFIVAGSLPVSGGNWFLPGTQAAALAALVVILMLPVRYVFTDRAVSLGNGTPTSYKAFRRFILKPGKRWLADTTTVILEGRKTPRGTSSSLRLFIPTKSVPEVSRVLKRRIH